MTSGDRLITASAHCPHSPAAAAARLPAAAVRLAAAAARLPAAAVRLPAVVAQSAFAHGADIAVAVFVVIMVIVVVAITIAGRHTRKWGPRSPAAGPPTRSQRAAAADEAAALRQGDTSNPDAPGNQQDDL